MALSFGARACSAPAYLARSAPSQKPDLVFAPQARLSPQAINPYVVTCQQWNPPLCRKPQSTTLWSPRLSQPNSRGWLSKHLQPRRSGMSGRRGPVSMVFGSGGQQQQRSQQGPSTAPAWHPLEDLGPRSKEEVGVHEGKLSPAEGARTLVETKEEGVLFSRIFPEALSEGLDVSYVTDERGDLYFEVDGIEWEGEDAQYLEQEDVTVVVGYTDYDEDEMMEDEADELSGYLLSDSDSEDSADDDDSNLEVVGMVDDYLTMLRGRGVPLDDISAESFGTLGAYGGLDTLETVHPLDFAIRLSEAVEAYTNPEVEVPQARVTLRGTVELVSPEEERRVRKEWLRRGALAQEEEARKLAATVLHDVSGRKEGENARKEEENARLARERADAALEQLRRDLQRGEMCEEGAGGSAEAARHLDTASVEAKERDTAAAEKQPQLSPSMPAGSGADVTNSVATEEGKPGSSAAEPSKLKIAALLRRRLKDLNGFPRPGRSRGEEEQGLEDEESDEPASSSEDPDKTVTLLSSKNSDELSSQELGDSAEASSSEVSGSTEPGTIGSGEDSESELESDEPDALLSSEDASGGENEVEPVGLRVESGKGTPDTGSPDTNVESTIDAKAGAVLLDANDVRDDRGSGEGAGLVKDAGKRPSKGTETFTGRRPSEETETVTGRSPSTAAAVGAADRPSVTETERIGTEQRNGNLEQNEELDGGRINRGAEASTSGSDADGSAAPLDMGGFGRWLTSLEKPETPIIWDQNTGRLWLGRDVQMSGTGLGNGVHGLGGLLWGDAEDDVEDDVWRETDGESEEDEERPREGPPLYRLRVTSVSFKSPTGAEWQVAVSDYASAQPDVLCEASATLMEQVNHAGHKVARALVKLCERTLGIVVDDAAMVAVDRFGFDLRVSQGIEMKTLRVTFPEVAFDEDHAMLLLEDMMWLNKKPDKKAFHYRRPPMDDLGKVDGFVK